MDTTNFNNYKNGRKHKYFGGLAKRSPVRLTIPSSGNWHVTVDMQGLRGSVRTSIRMMPTALPELRQQPLSSVPSLLHHQYEDAPPLMEMSVEMRDVFISHASEDKLEVVKPLALALQSHGLSVWYDDFELKIGDSLRRKIDRGLANSRFGIVVLSKNFIKKDWPNYELDGLVTRSVTGEQILLPIWHNITKQEVVNFSPSLADKVARNTASSTIDEIAAEISELIKNDY